LTDDTQKQEDSMEDILASIRETVEEEVGKAESLETKTEADASEVSDDDIASDLLTEDISDGDEADALAVMAAAQDQEGASEAEDASDSDIDDLLAESNEDASESSDEKPSEETSEAASDSDIDGLLAESNEDTSDEKTDDADSQVVTEVAEVEESVVEEDVLELTDVVEQGDPADQGDLIDVNKFAQSGEISQANDSDVTASRESYGAAKSDSTDDDLEVDLDGIMNELEAEGEIPSSSDLPSEADAASFIAENNVESDGSADDMMAESNDGDAPQTTTSEAVPVLSEDTVEKATQAAATEIAQKVFLPTIPSAKGLQVSFPSEVLAEALRPLVSDWINQNLGDIVERLVKEEISKLVEK
jgi:cell pole-organizing protein PopZ